MRFGPRVLLSISLLLIFTGAASAEPGDTWEKADPAQLGWTEEKLEAAEQYFAVQKPTALMIVQDGKIVGLWGDAARKVRVASVRKSFLSALYGIAVDAGKIKLDATLAELGLDDKPPGLTDDEKQATVRELLQARSGIYHPAAHETADIRKNRPERGSHPHGTFWFYNNWDFNVLGTIYRDATGEDLFDSFSRHIAKPLQMQDFSTSDGRYVVEEASIHPAYPFNMSARDMARFGLLYLQNGQWNGRQVVPASWIADSIRPYSRTAHGNIGYGYLWWVPPPEMLGPGAFYASGYGGQFIAIIPARHLVVVQSVDLRRNAKRLRTRDFLQLLKKISSGAS